MGLILFSNRFYLAKIVIAFSLIIISCIYGYIKLPHHVLTIDTLIDEYDRFIDREVALEGKAIEVSKNRFILKGRDKKIDVKGEVPGLKKGEGISIGGVFRGNYIKMTWYHVHMHKGKEYKLIFSIFPPVLLFYLFLKRYRFTRKGICQI